MTKRQRSASWLDDLFPNARLRRLALIGIAVPLTFVVIYSYWLLGPGSNLLESVWGFPVLIASTGLAITVFSSFIFGAVGRLQRNVETLSREAHKRNAQLRALNKANLALSQETLPSSVLQRVVDLSRELVRTRYAALSVIGDDGEVKSFHVSGIDEATRGVIGKAPLGQGMLRLVMENSGPLRLNNISDHPSFTGFPPGHPEMKTFLGTSIVYKTQVVGSLYLAEKEGGDAFTSEDEEIVQMFASQAAVTIQNARLYEHIQVLAVETERSRISREMHDGLAQVLSFVNTKAQAVETFLANGDLAAADEHVRELSQAARSVYHDVREGILALRAQVGSGRELRDVLEEYLSEYEYQSRNQIKVKLQCCPDDMRLGPLQEVQVLRIIQESLTNVRKHAEATHVELNFISEDDGLEIEIKDDGRGFEPLAIRRKEWPHFGIQTMQERAEAIGGAFEIISVPGKGTTVRVRVPYTMNERPSGGGA